MTVDELNDALAQLKKENEELRKIIAKYGNTLNACLSSIKAVAE